MNPFQRPGLRTQALEDSRTPEEQIVSRRIWHRAILESLSPYCAPLHLEQGNTAVDAAVKLPLR